jgi:hypothetical protein
MTSHASFEALGRRFESCRGHRLTWSERWSRLSFLINTTFTRPFRFDHGHRVAAALPCHVSVHALILGRGDPVVAEVAGDLPRGPAGRVETGRHEVPECVRMQAEPLGLGHDVAELLAEVVRVRRVSAEDGRVTHMSGLRSGA